MEVEFPVRSDFVDWDMVVESKLQHVIGRIPAGRDIMRHHMRLETKLLKLGEPLREDDCQRVLDRVGKGSKL